MLLARALYASTAHENTPRCDLDLLYHDGRAHRLTGRDTQGRAGLGVAGRAASANGRREKR